MLIRLQQQSMRFNSLKSARGVEGVRELEPPPPARRRLPRRRLPRGAQWPLETHWIDFEAGFYHLSGGGRRASLSAL